MNRMNSIEGSYRKGRTKIVALASKRRLYVVNNRLRDLINICAGRCDRDKRQ